MTQSEPVALLPCRKGEPVKIVEIEVDKFISATNSQRNRMLKKAKR